MRNWMVAVLCTFALAACGGDDGTSSIGDNPFNPGSNTNDPSNPGTPVTPPGSGDIENPANPRLARISLAASQYTVKSDNSDTATLTVTALDWNNAAMGGVTVSIHASTGLLNAARATTGEDGTASFNFRAGPERANQVATVTVASGAMVKTVPILITGTTMNLDASKTSVVQYDPQGIALTGRILDAAGKPLFGQEVSISSSLGNTLTGTDNLGQSLSGSSINTTTDINGGFRATFNADLLGRDTIALNGCGVPKEIVLTVKDTNSGFVQPAQGTSVPEGSSVDLVVQWEENGGPAEGAILSFAASHGHFEGESAPGRVDATADSREGPPSTI